MVRLFIFVCFLFVNGLLNAQVVVDSDSLSIELDEVVIKAAWVKHSADSEEYIVTDEMREKGITALELLNKVHGLRLDRVTNRITINNKSNVLLIVNGKEYAYDYIKSISPDNITRIRVIKNPKGRYLSEGYDAVIDLSVRYYDGIDFVGSNFLILNPSKNNGKNHVMMEQPMASFTYTKNKLSLFGTYVYGVSKWNTAIDKSFVYKDITNHTLRLSSDNGMEKYDYHGNSLNTGINFQLTPNHELSAEFTYKHENISLTENESYRMNGDVYANDLSNVTCTPVYTGTIFYMGNMNEKVNIYSDLSYNYLENNVCNRWAGYMGQDSVDFLEDRAILKHTTDVDFRINEQMSLKLGYFFNWKKFTTKDSGFKYSNTHYRVWNYFSYHPTENLSLDIGAGEEIEKIVYGGTHKTYFRLLPSLQVNYKPTSKFNVNLSYVTDGVYPSLSTMNTVQIRVNPIATQTGNPYLKSTVNHKIASEFTLLDRFTFSPSYLYSHNAIVRLVQDKRPLFEFSYFNADIKQLSLPLRMNQSLGNYFNITAGAEYYHSWGKYRNTNKVHGWLYDINLSYCNKGYMVDLGYNRTLSKQNIIQGFSESGFDSWVFTFNKQWFDGKLSTLFTWLLPLECGVEKHNRSLIHTVDYQEKISKQLRPYRNAILIQLIYRFSAGKSRTKKSQSNFDLEQRISGGFL